MRCALTRSRGRWVARRTHQSQSHRHLRLRRSRLFPRLHRHQYHHQMCSLYPARGCDTTQSRAKATMWCRTLESSIRWKAARDNALATALVCLRAGTILAATAWSTSTVTTRSVAHRIRHITPCEAGKDHGKWAARQGHHPRHRHHPPRLHQRQDWSSLASIRRVYTGKIRTVTA